MESGAAKVTTYYSNQSGLQPVFLRQAKCKFPLFLALTFGAEFETVSPLSRANAAAFITRTTGIPVHSAIGGVPERNVEHRR